MEMARFYAGMLVGALTAIVAFTIPERIEKKEEAKVESK